jgi:hypothetical protein
MEDKEKHLWFQELRKDAKNQSKKQLQFTNIKKLKGKEPIQITKESVMHKLLDIDKIDYYINNDLSLNKIYRENAGKYNKNKGLSEMWED